MPPEYRPARPLTDNLTAARDFFNRVDGRASPAGRVRLDPGQAARFCPSASSVGGLPGPDRPGRMDTERVGRDRHLWVRPAETGLGRGPPTGGPPRSGGFGGAVLLPCLFSFSWVNARAALPCPKAPVGTAKRRLQAQQKSACRYSRNSKRRPKAQQKSACRYSRP